MSKQAQISAPISDATRELLEQHVRSTGVKKGHLVEQALLHHLQALRELPADILVHPRIVITRRSAEQLADRLTAKPRPKKALRELMRGD